MKYGMGIMGVLVGLLVGGASLHGGGVVSVAHAQVSPCAEVEVEIYPLFGLGDPYSQCVSVPATVNVPAFANASITNHTAQAVQVQQQPSEQAHLLASGAEVNIITLTATFDVGLY
ncbi:hypothetical protein [Sorangium sp. So ce1099]|uniref:hypothetical protein n=1 Tax=Sorangium sp. So ce1099 TaxID=3133331 RepID=UPI003F62EE95